MAVEFTSSGYIEVWRDGVKISQHRQEREAVESITRHAYEEGGDGDYEIRYPTVMAKAYGVLNPFTGDTEAPTIPQNVVATPVSATEIDISWDASTDNVGVIEYQLFRDLVPVDIHVPTTSYSDSGLTPSTQYSYTVSASDAAGNTSAESSPGLATTNANAAPAWNYPDPTIDESSGYSQNLNLVCSDADSDPLTYSIASGSLPPSLLLSGSSIAGTADAGSAGSYPVTLRADDGITFTDLAMTWTVQVADVTAPAAPSNPSATASQTISEIDLDWDDNSEPDLASYTVYRSTAGPGGPFGVRQAGLVVSAYTDTGLNADTQYWYYITATDTSDNESSASTTVTDTTLPLGAVEVGVFAQDAVTPEQIALYAAVTGSVPALTTAQVEYKLSTEPTVWTASSDLWRISAGDSAPSPPQPVVDAFAGCIFNLLPGLTYDVRITLNDGVSQDVRGHSFSTRALPAAAPLITDNLGADPTQAALQTALDNASPGDRIYFDGTVTLSSSLTVGVSGTEESPIYLTGASRSSAEIVRADTDVVINFLDASWWVLEDMGLKGNFINAPVGTTPSTGVGFFSGSPTQTGNTFRRLNIDGVDLGVVASAAIDDTLIYDCTINGNNAWTQALLESNQTWDDDGLRIPGTGNCAWNNTLRDFGDTCALQDGVFSAATFFYRNKIRRSGDDAVEAEYGTRNYGFYDNHVMNCNTAMSCDGIYGGPFYYFRNRTINTGRTIIKNGAQSTGVLIWANTFVKTLGNASDDGGFRGWYWSQVANVNDWEYRDNLFLWEGGNDILRFDEGVSGWQPVVMDHNGWGRNGNNINYAGSGLPSGDVATVNAALTPIHDNDIEVTDQAAVFNTPVVFASNYLTEITTEYSLSQKAGSEGEDAGVVISNISESGDVGAYGVGETIPDVGDNSSIPAYVSSLAAFDVLTLSSVTNGDASYNDFMNGRYASAPKNYVTGDPLGGTVERAWESWCGGFGPGVDSQTHQMVAMMGGHADSAYNGICGFDFNGASTPVGWVVLDDPSDTADFLDASNRYADGRPTSVHTYHGMATLPGPKYFRVGGAWAAASGGFYDGTEIFEPGVGWGASAKSGATGLNGTTMVVYDEVSNKVFLYSPNVAFQFWFYDVAGDSWSSGTKSGNDPNASYATMVHDPVRRTANPDLTRAFLFGSSSPANQVWDIDWGAETVVDNGTHNASTTVGGGNGGFYDAVTDALWVFGNGTSSFSTIYRLTGLATPSSLTTQSNAISASLIVGSGVQAGFFGRWVWMPDWRALGFAGAYDGAAQIVKLP